MGRECSTLHRQPREFRGIHKRIPATSIYFESLSYQVHPATGLIDFDDFCMGALLFRPAMVCAMPPLVRALPILRSSGRSRTRSARY